jgi:hypothetical protein
MQGDAAIPTIDNRNRGANINYDHRRYDDHRSVDRHDIKVVHNHYSPPPVFPVYTPQLVPVYSQPRPAPVYAPMPERKNVYLTYLTFMRVVGSVLLMVAVSLPVYSYLATPQVEVDSGYWQQDGPTGPFQLPGEHWVANQKTDWTMFHNSLIAGAILLCSGLLLIGVSKILRRYKFRLAIVP